MHESEKWKWVRSVVSDSSWPHGLQPTRILRPWDFPGKSTGVECRCLLHEHVEPSGAIKNCFFVSMSLVDSMVSGFGYLSFTYLKSWGDRCWIKTLHTQGRSWRLCKFLSNCMSLCQGEVLWQECVSGFSTHFIVGTFTFTWHVEVSQLVSGFLSDELFCM